MAILFAVLIMALGCSEPKQQLLPDGNLSVVQDWRHGASDICRVHQTTMRTEVVYGIRGDCFIRPTRAYADARPQLFPHAGIDYGPDMYSKERGKIYVCPDCAQARTNWRKDHP